MAGVDMPDAARERPVGGAPPPRRGLVDIDPVPALVAVLEGIVSSATNILRAGFGVLLLADADRKVTRFLTSGLDHGTNNVIGDLRGLTHIPAEVLEARRPLRLAHDVHIAEHAARYGFPPSSPPVTSLLGLPIRTSAGPHGYLYLANKQGESEFSDMDERAAVALAATARITLESGRQRETGPWPSRWLDAVSDLVELLTGEVDRDEALYRVARLLAEISGADGAAIALIDNDDIGRRVFVPAAVGPGLESVVGEHLPREGFLTEVIDAGEPVVSDDITDDPRISLPPRWAASLSVLDLVIALPFTAPDEVLGVLLIAWRRDARHPRDNRGMLALLETFAGAAALVLGQIRLREESDDRQRWLDAAADVTRVLVGSSTLRDAMRQVTRRIREVSGAVYAAVALADRPEPGASVVFEALDGLGLDDFAGTRIQCPSQLVMAMETGHPIVSEDVTRDERYDPPAEWREALSVLGKAMFVPLTATGDVLGVLIVGWLPGGSDRLLATGDIQPVETFAGAAALAVQRIRALEERGHRQRWLDASSELTALVLAEVDRDEALRALIRRLRDVSGADVGAIVTPDTQAPEGTFLMVLEGRDAARAKDLRIPRRGLVKAVFDSGHALVSDDITHEEGYEPPPGWADRLAGLGLGMLVPLSVAGEVLGVLLVGWAHGSPHERAARRETQLVHTFADQAALALQRGRAQEDRERRQRWLEATSELTRALVGEVDRDEAIRLVIRRLREVSGADYAAITLLDPTGRADTVIEFLEGFSVTDLDALGSRHVSHIRVPRKGLTASVLESGMSIVSNDFTTLRGYAPSPELVEPLSAIDLGMLIPLIAAGEVMGVLFVAWRRGSPDGHAARAEAPLVETFADQAALALYQARAKADQARRERWLEATSEVARLLLSEVDRDEAMSLVVTHLRGISGADLGGVILVDPTDPASLSVVVFEGVGIAPAPPDMRIPREGLVGRVIESGERIVSDNYPHLEGHQPPRIWAEALSRIGLGMVMPIATDGEVLGVLFAGWQRGSPHEKAASREAPEVQTFADLASLALQRVRAQGDSEHLLLLQDHEQIAYGLHDAVLQRLFAVGLHLQSATRLSTDPAVKDRVGHALEDLERTTQQVRSTISRLSGKDLDGSLHPE